MQFTDLDADATVMIDVNITPSRLKSAALPLELDVSFVHQCSAQPRHGLFVEVRIQLKAAPSL